MPRVLGIDPGTVSIDICGLDDARVFLERSLPTADALSDASALVEIVERARPLDLIAGPSGYGLPLVAGRELGAADVRLACLSAEGDPGGIGGLGSLMRALARLDVPVVFTPGVIHLASVPSHRKVNRVDLGTADKLCVALLAIDDQMRRLGLDAAEVSLILLELGGAFTAAVAVQDGRIVDGLGGSSGPIGLRAAGALDGEVAFLAGTVTKDMLFRGGAADVAGIPAAGVEALTAAGARSRLAREVFVEGAVKAALMMMAAVPRPREVVLSGRVAAGPGLAGQIADRLQAATRAIPVHVLTGLAGGTKSAAQGAALLADGLAGGAAAALVDRVGVRQAGGTVLDHLHVITPASARRRLGLTG